NNWGHAGGYTPQYRLTSLGIQFRGRVSPPNNKYTSNRFFHLPWDLRPSYEMDFAIAGNLHSGNPRLRIEPDGSMHIPTYGRSDLYWIDLSGIIAPIDPWLG
ncbi:hypothetical protein, partial [Yaniella sp.]|uniref:hypothetical protein n=1 Tax=Yaniella sp. TaxID=2773929 RepID=UPI002649BA01